MGKVRIVGIGGLPRSGKDSLAELFVENGYFGVSLGDIVRDIARERHASEPDPISVANMTETSNWLRSQRGADFALQEALDRYATATSKGGSYKGLVVWSVRAQVEADFILSHGGTLIWVETEDAIRHERAMKNMRVGEQAISLDEFKTQEMGQWQPRPNVPPEIQMNVAYIKAHATHTLENNGNDVAAFSQKGRALIEELSRITQA